MDDQENRPLQTDEPTVLDYLRYRLSFKKSGEVIKIPVSNEDKSSPTPEVGRGWPWRTLGALLFALAAQVSFEPSPDRGWIFGVCLYGIAFGLLVWAYLKSECVPTPPPEDLCMPDSGNINSYFLILTGIFSALAFLAFSGNRFNLVNLILWLLATGCILRAFWMGSDGLSAPIERLKYFISRRDWSLQITWDHVLFALIITLAVFFRTHLINVTPPEMISDHAEKLLDVVDVLNGKTSIFFPRNTGREAFQFYLIALTARLFGTGISFLSMKIGTIALGLLTLPYIYLLGKEVGNRQAGLYAMAFAGIAYWPNIMARIALRFTLYPLFVAPTLYYLIRGLRTSNRNDFILAGLALGIGLHTYTPIRILPFVVILAIGLYLVHKQSAGQRKITIVRFLMLATVAFVLFLPLLRYITENPDMFLYRAFTRVGTWERPFPGPVWQIFLQNLWHALRMFGWDNGDVWTVSIPHRPALDVVTSALFHLGAVLLVVRYVMKRHWRDLFLLLSIPMLMMPSILSLAFPAENPVLSRTSGALIPVFVIVGIALESILRGVSSRLDLSFGKGLTLVFGIVLFGLASLQNYDLVFRQYQQLYEQSSWNTSEMGKVIQGFANSVGSTDTAWVVGYPYWVDTRLVGINAGLPSRDYAIMPDDLESTVTEKRAKLFLINPQDQASLERLTSLYPRGSLSTYPSQVEGHNFLLLFVPAE